jgi:hypothetical protein
MGGVGRGRDARIPCAVRERKLILELLKQKTPRSV